MVKKPVYLKEEVIITNEDSKRSRLKWYSNCFKFWTVHYTITEIQQY